MLLLALAFKTKINKTITVTKTNFCQQNLWIFFINNLWQNDFITETKMWILFVWHLFLWQLQFWDKKSLCDKVIDDKVFFCKKKSHDNKVWQNMWKHFDQKAIKPFFVTCHIWHVTSGITPDTLHMGVGKHGENVHVSNCLGVNVF